MLWTGRQCFREGGSREGSAGYVFSCSPSLSWLDLRGGKGAVDACLGCVPQGCVREEHARAAASTWQCSVAPVSLALTDMSALTGTTLPLHCMEC